MKSIFTLYVKREPAVIAAYAVLAFILFCWFATTPNISLTSITVSLGAKLPLVLVSIGATIVIVARGIDLSVGGTLALSNVIIAGGSTLNGNVVFWIIVALIVAIAVGAINGVLVSILGLPSIVVTLAMQSILVGLSLYVLPIPGGNVPVWFSNIPLSLVGPLPLVLLIMIGLPILIWYPIRRSRFGTALYAVGSDPSAGFVVGLNVVRTTIVAFVLSAFFACLGGIFLTMNTASGDPNIGTPYTLNSIAAAVLGGALLAGGRGTIAGAIAGALTLSFINNLLFSLGINTYWQYVVTGVLLVAVLALPSLFRSIRFRRTVIA
jgi:ribose transport system permease protein